MKQISRSLKISYREIGPKGGDNPTDLDKGLQAADELLNSVSGTKEIIIISDGLIDPNGLAQTKKYSVGFNKERYKNTIHSNTFS